LNKASCQSLILLYNEIKFVGDQWCIQIGRWSMVHLFTVSLPFY